VNDRGILFLYKMNSSIQFRSKEDCYVQEVLFIRNGQDFLDMQYPEILMSTIVRTLRYKNSRCCMFKKSHTISRL